MAHSVDVFHKTIEGINSVVYADLTFSGTYVTGGETLSPTSLGLTNIVDVTPVVTSLLAAIHKGSFNRSTGKLQLTQASGAQVGNGASISGATVRLRVVGS